MASVGGENHEKDLSSVGDEVPEATSSTGCPPESEKSSTPQEAASVIKSTPLNASKLKAVRHKAKYTIKKLEKKLDVLNRHIKT